MGNGRDISKDKLGRSLLGDAVASRLVAASLFGAGTASAWCASADGINLGKQESTMLKKLVVGAIAAGVLAVPLAGVAGADPSQDNPGTPGNLGAFVVGAPAAIPPGQIIKQRAQLPGSVKDVAIAEGFANPGDAVNNFAPGHNK